MWPRLTTRWSVSARSRSSIARSSASIVPAASHSTSAACLTPPRSSPHSCHPEHVEGPPLAVAIGEVVPHARGHVAEGLHIGDTDAAYGGALRGVDCSAHGLT